MARKRKVLGKLLVVGGLACAGVVVYQNRDKIRSFIEELTGAGMPEEEEPLVMEDLEDEAEALRENDIVIEVTEEPAEEETAEPAPEED